MGANLSNCQLTKLDDVCYSPVSMIKNTLNETVTNNFVLNLEKSKFELESNNYWFTCIEGSVPYNGTLNCNIEKHAEIICGSSKLFNLSLTYH